MKNFLDYYKNIENPLSDDNLLLSIIEIYSDNEIKNSDSDNKNSRFNSKLQHYFTNKSNKHISKFYPGFRDELYKSFFEVWKENIINMTPEKFKELYSEKYSINDEDFQELVKYLKEINPPSNYKEVFSIINSKVRNPLLNKAMSKYSFTAEDPNFLSSWTHITSSKLAEKKEENKIKHALYINTGSKNIDLFVINLLTEFLNKKMSFNFKFDKYADRDDSIVVYLADSELEEGINILNKVRDNITEYQKKYPQYKRDFEIYEPPILANKIDGWIGYTQVNDDKEELSNLNLKGTQIIPNAISKATKVWLSENKEVQTEFEGYKLNYLGYFAKRMYDEYMGNLYHLFDQLKYNPKDLQSKRLRKKVFSHIANYVEAIANGKESNNDVVCITFYPNEEFVYNKDDAYSLINSFAFEIANKDHKFLDIVRDCIKEEYEKNDIKEDSLNYNKKYIKQNNLSNPEKNQEKKSFTNNIEIAKRLSKKYLKNSPNKKIPYDTIKEVFDFLNSNMSTFVEQLDDDSIEKIIYDGTTSSGFDLTISKNDIEEIINEINSEKNNINNDSTER